LRDKESTYSPTRLSGSPLGFHNSRIDYIIVSKDLMKKRCFRIMHIFALVELEKRGEMIMLTLLC